MAPRALTLPPLRSEAVGVGRRSEGSPAPQRFGVGHCHEARPSSSAARHVGQIPGLTSWATAVAMVTARLAPDGLVPPTSAETRPPEPSDASGIGRRMVATSGRFGPPSRSVIARPLASLALGVGRSRTRDDEQALSAVGRADVGRSYKVPPSVVPDFGKVGQDDGEPASEMSRHIFQDDETWPEGVDPAGDVGPEVAVVIDAAPESGVAEGLAGVPSGEDVGMVGAPIEGGYVTEVRDVGVVSGEHGGGAVIELGKRGQVDGVSGGLQDGRGGHVQAAVARA